MSLLVGGIGTLVVVIGALVPITTARLVDWVADVQVRTARHLARDSPDAAGAGEPRRHGGVADPNRRPAVVERKLGQAGDVAGMP